MNNLESEIYRLSFELSQSLDENEINKLLGILSSDGVYAMWVYAMDKFNDKNNKHDKKEKKDKIENLLKEMNKFVNALSTNNDIDNRYFQTLAQDLNKLLFMKELLEKVFIYARYHARAKGN